MLKKSLVAALLFMAANSVAYSATDIEGGTVSGEWTLVGSPYLVHGDIFVAGLVITPGVEVRLDGDCGIEVLVALMAEGTAPQPIIFTAADPANRWTGISFEGVAPGSILKQCHVEYANNSGIRITNSTPAIENCIISNNTSPGYGGGLYASLNTGTLILVGCDITDNTTSPLTSGHAFGGGVYVSGNSQIYNCEILRNVCYAYSSSSLSPGSYGGGLNLTGGTHEIRNSNIAENDALSFFHFSGVQGVSGAYGGGIAMDGDVEIYNSTVVGNTISAWDDATLPNVHQGGGIRGAGNSTIHNVVLRGTAGRGSTPPGRLRPLCGTRSCTSIPLRHTVP